MPLEPLKPDQRKIAVHLLIVTVSGALGNAVKQGAGQVQRAIGVPLDTVE
jgi:hypothetical protein